MSGSRRITVETATNKVTDSALDFSFVSDLKLGSLAVSDSLAIRTWDLGSVNGTRLGASNSKLAFFGAAPIAKPAGSLKTALLNLGLVASPTLNFSELTGAAVAGQIPNLDAAKITTGAFDPARIPSLDWSKIATSKPTTIAGYGITDHTFANLVAHPTTIGGYGITDLNSLGDARWSLLGHTHAFSSLTGAPTTIAGYGIIDHTFANLVAHPTTIGGYGITDLNSLGDARWSLLSHTHAYSALTGLPVIPSTSSPTASNFLTAYDAATGLFAKAQPAFSDLTGAAVAGQIPNLDAAKITTGIFPKAPLPVVTAYTDAANVFSSPQDFVSHISGSFVLRSLATPVTPTVITFGVPGATLWRYRIVAKLQDGTGTNAGASGDISTGNATLDTNNYNNLSWAAVPGAYSYDIYRVVAGLVPATIGKIGNVVAATTYNDQGAAGDGAAAPTVNTTGNLNWLADNTSDLGGVSANRPRDINAARNVNALGGIFATAAISGAASIGGLLTGLTASFSSTVRGKIQDKGGAVYHVKSAAIPLAGDGVTDDTAALQALVAVVIAAGGGTILFDPGTFILHGLVTFSGASKINLHGTGRGATIIKSTIPVDTPVSGEPILLFFNSCSYFNISGITFDNNNIITTNDNTFMVAGLSCHDFTVSDCEFLNQKRHGLGLNNCQRFWIRDNSFFASGGNTILHSCILLIGGLATGPGWITNNEVVGTNVGGDGSDITIEGNKITGSTSGAGIASNGVSGGVHFAVRHKIIGNTIIGTGGTQDLLGIWISGIECDAYNSIVSKNIVLKTPGIGIALGGKYILVDGNECYDCGSPGNPSPGIANNYQNADFNAGNSTISNNICRQIDGTHQAYGFQDIGAVGQTHGIQFRGNDFSGNGTAPYFIAAGNNDYTFDNYSKTITLSAAAASFPDLAVPGGCKTVRLAIQARGVDAAATSRLALRLNGDSGANYNFNEIGEIVTNGTGLTYMVVGDLPAATAPAGQSGIVDITIPNVSGTTFKKGLIALLQRWSGTFPVNAQIAGHWFSTAPITSITLLGETNNLAAGSTVTAHYEF